GLQGFSSQGWSRPVPSLTTTSTCAPAAAAASVEDRKNLVTRLDVEILLVTTTRTIEEGRGKRQLPSDLGNQQPAR
ncbi:hypothetical protein, partial [Streptomyces sp. NPDC003857]